MRADGRLPDLLRNWVMRTLSVVLPLLLAGSLNAQVPHVTPAPPFTSMSRVPVSDFAADVIAAPGRQERPAIATDGTNLMAVWADRRYGNFDVFASRLDQYGFPIDKLGIPVAPTYFEDFDPSIAWNGTDYGVVWATQYGLFFARISSGGIVSSPRKIFDTFVSEPGGLEATAIAWNGEEYLVAFSYKEPNTSGATLDGLLMSRDGTLRSDRFAISQPLTGATNPSIATDGTSFLVAWDETETRRTLATIVSATGAVSTPRLLGTIPTMAAYWAPYASHSFPAAAINGNEYVVVWTDFVLHAQRLATNGEPTGDPRVISDLARFAITPAVTATGDGWIVTWADSPTSPDPANPDVHFENLSSFDIVSAKLARDLSFISVSPVYAGANGQYATAVVGSREGAVALWQDRDDVSSAALEPDSQPAGPLGVIAFGIANQKEIAIAVSGDVTLVAWRQEISDSTWAAFWRRYRSDGTPLDPQPTLISWGDPGSFLANADSVSVAASDEAFLLVFSDFDTSALIGIRIERVGDLLDPWGFPIANQEGSYSKPSAASDGQDFLVAWSTPTDQMDWLGRPLEEIRAAHVTASGNVSKDVVIAPSSRVHHYNPVATWTGDKYAVAWSTFEQSVYPLTGISMRYVGTAGEPEGEPFIVESVRHYGQQAESIASGVGLIAIGAGIPDYGSVYFVDGTAISQSTRVGPYVLWDGTRFVSGDVPMATFGDGHNVAIGTNLIRMLPASHAGGVNRVYVGFFNSLRTRAVRRN